MDGCRTGLSNSWRDAKATATTRRCCSSRLLKARRTSTPSRCILQTREEGRAVDVLEAKNAAVVPMFDHGIAFLPGPGPGGRSATSTPRARESRLGPLPSMDARAVRRSGWPGRPGRDHAAARQLARADHGSDVTLERCALHPGWISGDLVGDEQARGRLRRLPGCVPTLTQAGRSRRTTFADQPRRSRGCRPAWSWRRRSTSTASCPRGRALREVQPPTRPGWRVRSLDEHDRRRSGRARRYTSELAPLVRAYAARSCLPPQLAPMPPGADDEGSPPRPGFAWVDRCRTGGDENGGDFGQGSTSTIAARCARRPNRHADHAQDASCSTPGRHHGREKYPSWRAWLQRVDALMHKTVRMAPAGGAK